ncbi:MAG: GNAT family N-acetyltransferase [Planctomycetota bacterium]
MDELRLVKLTPGLEEAFRELQAEYAAAGEGYHRPGSQDFAGWLRGLRDRERGVVPEGQVPSTAYWLQRRDGRLLGGVRLRHRLSSGLWQDGGHIGYDIRPSERSRGYGTRMLALALKKAEAHGLDWVLLTVAPDNTPSIRVIEKNGGHLIGKAEESGNLQYRIDLRRSPLVPDRPRA